MSSNRSSNDYRELDVPDQTGKTFLVTGANTGIGFDAARVLANQNARVLLGCRSEEKAQLAIDRIQADKANADLSWIPLDLGDLKTVASAAEEERKEEVRQRLPVQRSGPSGWWIQHVPTRSTAPLSTAR